MPLSHRLWQSFGRNWQILLTTMVTLAVVLALGVAFFLRGRGLMEAEIKEKLRVTAAVAAQQFDAAIVESVRGQADMRTPAFAELVGRLRRLRDATPDIRFAYIMRRTEDPSTLAFVADADALATPAELDRNRDGVIQDDEEASYPGDGYDITEIPALQNAAFEGPSVDDAFTQDQWGALISGYAPIVDREGHAVAVLGIDMDARQFQALTQRIFSPVAFLLVCLVGFLSAGSVFASLWMRRLEALQRIDRERAAVLMLAMHQLGGPLTLFQWSLEMLRDAKAKGSLTDDDFEQQTHNLEDGTRRLHRVLSDLHDATRVEAGQLSYQSKPGYLRDVIVEVVHDLGDRLRARKQRVTLELDGNLQASFDHRRIADVLQELLANAMKFSRDGAAITVALRRRGKHAEVEVRDAGCGIPRADLPRIFGKFVRGANAHLCAPDGMGLGLFICRGTIQRAGGTMWIESKEGKGTSVFFTLPLAGKGS